MGGVTGVVVYILLWWMIIFMVLPWGLERDGEGKPENPNLKHKAIITSFIAGVLWVIVYFLVESDIFSFREMAVQKAASQE